MTETAGRGRKDIIEFLRRRDYVLIRELGWGACGRTVLLHDDQIDEHFVCKKYVPYLESRRAELFGNFTREIKLLHQVNHINVVRLFNYYLYPDVHTGYLLMEFVDGVEIDDYIAANPEKINDVFLQTIEGFAHLEAAGILHRDIRPTNIMVTNDGVVKIIDFGFGKQVFAAVDFDKSITLNWWCDTPQEFNTHRYDFSTEVYFVGKLFEQLIVKNEISFFEYTDILRKMCVHNPESRAESFAEVRRTKRNRQFGELAFSNAEQRAYRLFADEMTMHIVKLQNDAKYVDDTKRITRELGNVYQKIMLEETVPDCAIVISCFISGIVQYRISGFPVLIVRQFLDLLRSFPDEKLQILLANLHTRFDSIQRYSSLPEGDIPF